MDLFSITNGELNNNQEAIIYLLSGSDLLVQGESGSIVLQITQQGGYPLASIQDNGLIHLRHQRVYNMSSFIVDGGSLLGMLNFAITAEFPEDDTGYIEEGFDYCIEEGANLVASPCRDEIDIIDTLPSEIADNLTGIIGQGVAATNLNGNWAGSLSGLGGGNGYWMLSNVNACFNYNCAEN